MIAALNVTVDGFIEGPAGELDWVETWEDPCDLLPQIDTCILGRGMYSGYEQYWRAILAAPEAALPFTGKVATKGEVAYARFAEATPHLVVSTTLKEVDWTPAMIVRDLEAIRQLKQQRGKGMYAVGGATLVGSLLNEGLIDELRLIVHPVVLGGGKALFKDVKARHAFKLLASRTLESGRVGLTYSTQS